MKPLYLAIIGVIVVGTMIFLLFRATDEKTGNIEEEKEMATITGTVTYRQRIALTPDAIVQVKLEDVSLQDVAAELISEQTIESEGKQVPIPYILEYDPESIIENHTYSVSARIVDGTERLLFISDTTNPVITNDHPTEDVEIVVVPAN